MSAVLNIEQGTYEWLEMRKNYITATDAVVIMGYSKWKTPYQLFMEKTGPVVDTPKNAAMKRGIFLEPIARELFEVKINYKLTPKVVIKDWAMASLDGISDDGRVMVEIKCAGPRDHAIALDGRVPEHYYPQLQHQMYVTDLDKMFYFSFDGDDGVVVPVIRDQNFIDKMVAQELDFYGRLKSGTPPEIGPDDFVYRDDEEWRIAAQQWIVSKANLERAIEDEKHWKTELSKLAGSSNAKGCGISLSQLVRKGAVDYGKIPELKNVDLEKYRKTSSSFARITEI